MPLYISYAVILYDCQELASGCSSCLNLKVVQNLDCIWCNGHNGLRDNTSLFIGNCLTTPSSFNPEMNTTVTCPSPTITDFNPKSGPIEGGTTITITGTDLGVTFEDFTNSSITIGGVPCTPTDRDSYIPGRQINCHTAGFSSQMSAENIKVSLSSGQGLSEGQFTLSTPEIFDIFPSLGPVAGGTPLSVKGSYLNIGNTENTRITLVEGSECEIE